MEKQEVEKETKIGNTFAAVLKNNKTVSGGVVRYEDDKLVYLTNKTLRALKEKRVDFIDNPIIDNENVCTILYSEINNII